MTYRIKNCIKCKEPFVIYDSDKEKLCELHRKVPDEMFTHDNRRGYIHLSSITLVK
jgi:hypothetical protein